MRTRHVLLLTDLVDSTRLVETLGDLAAAAWWEDHDRNARQLTRQWRGREIDKSDGFLLLFEGVDDAVGYARAYGASLAALAPPQVARVGVHCGDVVVRENSSDDIALGAKRYEVDGIAKSVAARIMTLALGGQVLLSGPARAALEGGSWPVRSHGHWRLKGVEDPIEIFEVAADGVGFRPPVDSVKAFRVVRAVDGWRAAHELPNNLPAERDAFIGRHEAQRALASRFDEGARLVTLLGIGGIGKTRLALRHGRTWLGEYLGGTWFCDLAAARGVDGIVQAVAQALEVPLGKSDPVALLGDAIAGRGSCLLILDNFEQVARHAEQILGTWLDRAPQARFIATSRELLGIAGEVSLVLAPLDDVEAIQLFEMRARSVDSQWQPGADDTRDLKTLVDLLDRLPLAIELAAARIQVMGPRAMIERMGQRFRLLASTGRRHDRQATLQATLDWSWELLSPAEQSALAQLSVFEGGFSLTAAEAVVSFEGLQPGLWTTDVVQNLMRKSLLRRAAEGRFDLLRAVQDYAMVRAQSETDAGERSWAAAQRRHWRYFTGQGEPMAVGRHDVELDNLLVACRRATRVDLSDAALLLSVIWSRLKWAGPFGIALELADAILATADPGDHTVRRVAEETAGEVHVLLGNRKAAGEALHAALALSGVEGNELAHARIQCDLAAFEPAEGAVDLARTRLLEVLATAQRLDNVALQIRAMNNLARLLMARSQMQEAQRWYDRALALASSADDRRWMGGLHGNLGTLHHAQGRFELARRHYEQSLSMTRSAGNRQWEGNMRCNLGLLLLEVGDEQGARRELQGALEVARSIGHRRLEGTTLCNLGIAAEAAGQTQDALQWFRQSVECAEQMATAVVEAEFRGYLAAALARARQLDEAVACIERAEKLCGESDDPSTRAMLASQNALVCAHAGRPQAAASQLASAEQWLSRAESGAASHCRRVIDEVRALLAAP